MCARFTTNFFVLLLGAAVLIFLYALGRGVADWVTVGAGAAAIALAMHSFASAEQGIYQRIADGAIAAVGTWGIVAARVMSDHGDWLVFTSGLGLVGLGAVGLVVREIALGGGLQVGASHIGPDEFARLSTLQNKAQARR